MAITQISNNVILDGTILPAKLNISSALRTFFGSATSANLATAITDETGSGSLVFANSPILTTPTIATINGSTASNGSITVQGTSNATRTTSNVDLQPSGGGVTIGGTTRNASAILQINSTTLGFLPPVMTSTQRNAISSPASGLVVYSSDLSDLSLYNGTAWGDMLTTHAASFTSDTLRTAVSDETGSGSLVFATSPTITSPTIATSLVLNATSYSYGAGAREAMLNSMSNRFVYKDGLIPYAEIFDDFPTTLNGAGTHRWQTTSGTTAYYTNGSAQARFWGAISLTTAATTDASAVITAAPSGGANGQTSSRFGLSMQVCFCINNTTSTEFRSRFSGGGASIDTTVLFSTGVIQLDAVNIGGVGVNSVTVATGLSLAAGNFISGTRYRLFTRIISQTQTEVYFASAPWDSATWTTLVDTIVTHSAWQSASVSTQPFLVVVTKENVAKIAYIDWVAIRQDLQR